MLHVAFFAAPVLPLACRDDSFTNRPRPLAFGFLTKLVDANGRQHDVQVETIDDGSAHACAVRSHPIRVASASVRAVPQVPTRAWVHRGDDHRMRWKYGLSTRAAHRHETVFHRLPKRLECRSPKLRKLVEKEDPVMRKRELARARRVRSANDGNVACRVMRRAKRTNAHKAIVRLEQTCHRVNRGHLQRLRSLERRQDSRKPSREHRLARTRRPDEQNVVTTGRGNFHRATSGWLSANVAEIVKQLGLDPRWFNRFGRSDGSSKRIGKLTQVPNRRDRTRLGEHRFGAV